MRKFIYNCMKSKIFTRVSRLWEGKSPQEIESLRRSLAMIYAACGTQALIYFIISVDTKRHPTDPEELKKWYAKKKGVSVS